MPAALPALAGLAASGVVASITTSTLLIAGAGLLASAAVGALVTEKPDFGDRSNTLQGVLGNHNSSVAPIPVIYGSRTVGGLRVFVDSSGVDNEYLHLVIVWGEGEIESVDAVYLDGVISSDARFSGLVTISNYVGTDSQTADAGLVADITAWTSDHRLRGVAYSVVKMEYDPDAFAQGIPTVTADISGRKIYDTRTSTTGFSNNPALCIRDYLTNARYGLGIAAAEIDDASIDDAANYCETQVSIPPSGTQDRYTCDGYLDTDTDPIANLDELLSSCRGMLIFSGGTYRLIIDKPETPALTFDETNLTGAWKIQLDDRQRRYNRVKVEYFNPARSWKKDTAVVDSPTFRTADNGDLLETQIYLPFTADEYTAQQIAGIELRQSRYQAIVEVGATVEALRAEVGDVISLTHDVPGWSAKSFRVIGVELTDVDVVALTLLEYDVSVYTLDSLNEAETPPGTSLPDPFTVAAPTSLVITPQTFIGTDGTTVSQLAVSWTGSADAFVVGYEFEYKKSTDSTYNAVNVPANDLDYLISPAEPGATYDIRVRAVNSIGAHSAWLSNSDTAASDTTAPGIPTSVAAADDVLGIRLTWVNPSDADFARVEIWSSATSSHAAGSSLTRINAESFRDKQPAGTTRYYWIRAVDFSGNASAWNPSDAGAGVSGTAFSEIFDDDSFFNEIKPILQFSWRQSFEDRDWNGGAGWRDGDGGSYSRQSSGTPHAGTYHLQCDAAGGDTNARVIYDLTATELDAVRGLRAVATCWVKQRTGSATFRVGLWGSVGGWYGYVETITPSAYEQQRVITTKPIDPDETLLTLLVYPDRTDGNGGVYVDTIAVTAISDIIDVSNISDWIAAAAITEAYIGSAAITTAKIKDLNVEQLKIANRAVTLPESSFVDGQVNVQLAWVSLASKSITIPAPGTGESYEDVVIIITALVRSADTTARGMQLRFKRDSTVLKTITNGVNCPSSAANWATASVVYVDTPIASGTVTYSVEGLDSATPGVNVRNRYLSLAYLKK